MILDSRASYLFFFFFPFFLFFFLIFISSAFFFSFFLSFSPTPSPSPTSYTSSSSPSTSSPSRFSSSFTIPSPFSSLNHLGPEKGRTEVACQSNSGSAFTTGGGFSNLYQSPAWQKESTEKYFTAIAYELPYENKSRVREGGNGFPSPQYNPKGRGYPDISVLGEGWSVYALHIVCGYCSQCSAQCSVVHSAV